MTAQILPQTATAAATATRWVLDPAHSLVEFAVKHMMFTTVKGRFRDIEGEIRLGSEEQQGSSVGVTIRTASIDTGVEQRDDHLRSPDFFEVEAYPELRFTSRRVIGGFAAPGDELQIVGDLTIRDRSREVVLDVVYEGRGTDPWGGERVSFSAETKVDRREFGLTWNQALEAGGVLVGHDVKIRLEVQATLA